MGGGRRFGLPGQARAPVLHFKVNDLRDRRGELRAPNRLHDEGVDLLGFEEFDIALAASDRSNEDDRRCLQRRIGADGPRYGDAVRTGELHLQHDNIEGILRCRRASQSFQRVIGIRCLLDSHGR